MSDRRATPGRAGRAETNPIMMAIGAVNPPGATLSGKTYRPSLPADKGPAAAAKVAATKIRRAFCPPEGQCPRRLPTIRTAGGKDAPQPLFDAQGRRYTYRVVRLPLARIVASHQDDGAPDPRARAEFQARIFDIQRVRDMAKSLDLERLAPEGQSPTIGAPVVWLDPKSKLYHVLAGNHRFVASRLSGKVGKAIAVRELQGTLEDATRLAAASQQSDAAPETLAERGRAEARSAGLSLEDLPRDLGSEPITRDNVLAFLDRNPAFRKKLFAGAKQLEPADAAVRVRAALVGLLPQTTQQVLAAVGAKAEAAIAAAAPTLLYLRRAVAAGDALPVFDLLESFDRAAQIFTRFAGRGRSAAKIVEDLSHAAEQPHLFGGDLAHEIDQADAGLILGLASLENRASPDEAVAAAFAEVVDLSLRNNPKQQNMFGEIVVISRLDLIRVLFGVRIADQAKRFRPAAGVDVNPLQVHRVAAGWKVYWGGAYWVFNDRDPAAHARTILESGVVRRFVGNVPLDESDRAFLRSVVEHFDGASRASSNPRCCGGISRNPAPRPWDASDERRAGALRSALPGDRVEGHFFTVLALSPAGYVPDETVGRFEGLADAIAAARAWVKRHKNDPEWSDVRVKSSYWRGDTVLRIGRGAREGRARGCACSPRGHDVCARCAGSRAHANPSPEAVARVKAATEALLKAIERDDAVDMIARSALAQVPSAKWTISNRMIMWSQGTDDARGFRQWADAGRQIKAGARAIYILGPRIVTIEKEKKDADAKEAKEEKGRESTKGTDGGSGKKASEKDTVRVVAGFIPIPVFRLEDTEGDPVDVVEPKSPPPLLNVARRMGVKVSYRGGNGLAWGFYRPSTDEIVLHTHDADVFFHELAHAAHKRIRGSLKGGQDEEQEIVAEFSAAVLEKLYIPEHQHRTLSHVRYLRGYAQANGPAAAAKRCMSFLAEVDKVVRLILDEEEAEQRAAAGKGAARETVAVNPRATGLVRSYTRPLAQVRDVPGLAEAIARYTKFHGAPPTRVRVFEYEDGSPELRERALFALGQADAEVNVAEDLDGNEIAIKPLRLGTTYSVPASARSNKAGRQWIHSHREGGGKPPVVACDPVTGRIELAGGSYEVGGWIRS